MVTAPLIAALVGSGTAVVYLLAAIPAALVAAGMSANDRRDPHKGSVYTWVRRALPRTGWFAGFCLAATGVIATSGMAYVAADLLAPAAPAALKAALAAVLTALAALIDLYELRLMAALQYLAVIAGLGATIVCAGLVAGGGVRLAPMTGSPLDWFHAVLLAVFAYWGFDAIFALTDVTGAGAPQRVTALTMLGLMGFFAVGGTAYSAVDPAPVTGHLVVRVAVVSSAIMSLGSTLVPTARGIEAMADARQVPSWAGRLRSTSWTTAVVTAASVAWTGLLFVSEGLFGHGGGPQRARGPVLRGELAHRRDPRPLPARAPDPVGGGGPHGRHHGGGGDPDARSGLRDDGGLWRRRGGAHRRRAQRPRCGGSAALWEARRRGGRRPPRLGGAPRGWVGCAV